MSTAALILLAVVGIVLLCMLIWVYTLVLCATAQSRAQVVKALLSLAFAALYTYCVALLLSR